MLGLASAVARAEAPPAELLARLAEQEARVGRVLKAGAYTVSTEVEELDGSGKRVHVRQSVSRVSTVGGKQSVRVDKVLLDGKDITAAEREKMQNQKSREMQSPFAAAAQPRYVYTLAGKDTADPSKVRVRFEPKPKERSSSTFVGEAVVDPAAGEVVWMKERPAENPAFVDRLEFEAELTTQTAAGRQMARVRVEGAGGVPFFKKGFKVRLAFSDYDVGAAAAAPK